jgi:hypothetical protein
MQKNCLNNFTANQHTMSHPLREAVKHRFYLFAETQGFARVKSKNSLFTTFRKTYDDTVYEFEIQWDKYHRPYFVLNFSLPDGTGVVARTKHGRLQRKRGGPMSCWFNLRKPLLQVLRTGRLKYKPDEVVEHLISCFPEIEAWWSSGIEGPHVYCI